MNDSVNFRSFKQGDYEICCEWWKWWWKHNGQDPVRRAFLPKDERCFMLEKNGVPIASYFLFLMDPYIVGWATYLVSNPEYKEKDRGEAIELLIDRIEEVCKSLNYKYIFTMGRNKHLIETHRKLGWVVDKKSSYEITKKL